MSRGAYVPVPWDPPFRFPVDEHESRLLASVVFVDEEYPVLEVPEFTDP
jgi:hypothetical protein